MPGPKRLNKRDFITKYINLFRSYFLEGRTFNPNPDEIGAFTAVQIELEKVAPNTATLEDLEKIAELVNMTTSAQFLGARNRAEQVFNQSETYRRGRIYKKSRKRTKKKKKKVGGKCSKTKRLTTKRRRKSKRKSKRR